MLALPSLTMPSSSDQDSWCASWKYTSAKSTECVMTSPNTWSRRPSSRPLGRRIRSRAMLRGSAEAAGVACGCNSFISDSCSGVDCRENAVLKCREVAANFRLGIKIDGGHDTAATPRQPLQNAAPGVDDHAVAVGFAPAGMKPRLGRRNHVAKVLDGARAEQGLPVRPPRRAGERRRYRQKLRARGAQRAIQLGEANVVADRETELP